MAVRFLPPPAESSPGQLGSDRENLAEVIQLRSRLAPSGGDAPRGGEAPKGSNAPTGGYDGEPAALGDSGDAAAGEDGDLSVEASSMRTAMEDAVRMLARRARSSGELRRELVAIGHDPVEVDEVVLECESRLYLDDLGLARVLSERLRVRKRASRAQVRIKLRERLLPDGAIEEVLGELDDDEENDLLREAAIDRARKMGGLDRQTAERRLLGFLARRGWSGERAVRVAREALDRDARRTHSVLSSGAAPSASPSGTVRFR